MKTLSFAFVALAAVASAASLAGCKKRNSDSNNALLAKMIETRDQMCKCLDKACADKVSAEMSTWGDAQAKRGGSALEISEADAKKLEQVVAEMSKCMAKVTEDKIVPGSVEAVGSGAPAPKAEAEPAAGSNGTGAAGSNGSGAAGAGW